MVNNKPLSPYSLLSQLLLNHWRINHIAIYLKVNRPGIVGDSQQAKKTYLSKTFHRYMFYCHNPST